GQLSMYQDALFNTDSVWSATGAIATNMRQRSGGKYETELVEPTLESNKAIQQLEPTVNKALIERAIQDTNNANLIINMEAVKGKKLVLSEEMRKTLEILDK